MRDTGIKPQVLDEIRALAARHGLDRVILFGSRARGAYGRASDIDLAVSGGDAGMFALDAEEEISTPLFFDVVNLDTPLKKEFTDEIERDGIVIYEKA